MSQDGNSLYVTPKNGAPLDVVNTKSLAVTTVHIPNVGTMVGPVALSPASNYGLISPRARRCRFDHGIRAQHLDKQGVSQFFRACPMGRVAAL